MHPQIAPGCYETLEPAKIPAVAACPVNAMSILYLIIPVSIILVIGIIWVFLWAVRSGQFDDLEGPAHHILMDDDDDVTRPKKNTGAVEEDD